SGRAPRLASSISCAAEAVAIGTEAGVRIDGKLARAIRSPAFFGRAIPGAAAQHSFCARGRPLRVVTRTFLVIAFAVVVVAHLPDVAVHIKEAPLVRQLLPDRLRFAPGVRFEPGILRQVRRGVTEAGFAGAAGP